MFGLTRIERLAVVIAAILTLNACATLRINSYLERGVDFGRYRSYAWGPSDTFSTGDPRLDNNPFFSERVQSAVDRQLTTRGLEKTRAGASDLVVHIHASVTQRLDMDAIDREYRRCDIADCRAMVYEAGTLMLDFIDTRTNTLAWRGWAEGSLDGVIDDQRWMEETVDKAVERILTRLPRPAR
jgi:Domain of unknown function (DUF4136)